jgi:hypothetical protein
MPVLKTVKSFHKYRTVLEKKRLYGIKKIIEN